MSKYARCKMCGITLSNDFEYDDGYCNQCSAVDICKRCGRQGKCKLSRKDTKECVNFYVLKGD